MRHLDYRNEERGIFYFGLCSIPLKVNENTYRMKALRRRQSGSKYFDVVTVELSPKEDMPIELFMTNWMVKSELISKHPSDKDGYIYHVLDYTKPTSFSCTYNPDIWLKVAKKLCTLKPLEE